MSGTLPVDGLLLGTLIRHPQYIPMVMAKIKDASWFPDKRHRDVFSTLSRMSIDGLPISRESVAAELERTIPKGGWGILVEGMDWFEETETSDLDSLIAFGINTIVNRHQLDRVKRTCESALEIVKNPNITATEIISSLHEGLSAIDDGTDAMSSDIKSLVDSYLETLGQNANDPLLIPTHLPDLNKMIGGWYIGDMHIIGGSPSGGKTSLALPALRAACHPRTGRRGMYVALDETKSSMVQRAISADTGLNRFHLTSGKLNQEQQRMVMQAVERIRAEHWMVIDEGGLTTLDIEAELRKEKRRRGLDMVVIDYAQQIRSSGENQNMAMTKVSNDLKRIAKALPVAMIVVSQLIKLNEDRRPRLEDLRDTGTWAQDANLVLLVHRKTRDASTGSIEVAKQKQGPTGLITAGYDCPRMRWYSIATEAKYGTPPPNA